MTPSADPSPPRRPIFFPVVIATVFLTIIGMTGGFVLGERHRDTVRTSAEPTPQDSYGPVESTSAPDGPLCPAGTRAIASKLGFSSELRQVFRIETDHQNVVWICADPAGNLFYQGQTGGPGAKMVQGKNALFLSEVIRQGEDEYQVIAPSDHNRFEINRKQLIIHHVDGRNEVQNVVSD